MSPKVAIIVAVAIIAAAAIFAFSVLGQSNIKGENGANTLSAASGTSSGGSITIIAISGGSLVPNATYLVAPFHSKAGVNATVQDGGPGDSNPAAGVVTISGLASGNYTVTQQSVPSQFQRDKLSKLVTLLDSQGITISFTSTAGVSDQQQTLDSVKSVVYTSKFECGSINGSEGPLRPGHYDTDISIFNKQDFAVKVFITGTVTKGKTSNTILQTIQPHTGSSIVCKDLDQLINFGSSFSEGFVSIEAPRDAQLLGELSDNGAAVVSQQSSQIDLLDVQVFYTANSLDSLPHSVYADKISFTILNDSSGKIPRDQLQKTLDVTVTSDVGIISDPESQVKQLLAEKYSLTDSEANQIGLRIDGIGVGVGTMVDDHAISLSHITPQPQY